MDDEMKMRQLWCKYMQIPFGLSYFPFKHSVVPVGDVFSDLPPVQPTLLLSNDLPTSEIS